MSGATFNNKYLLTSFPSVTFPAKHLTVGFHSPSAFAPRGDVVAFHLLKGKLFLAVGADVMMLFPYGKFYVFGEGAQVEIMLVTSEDVGNDAEGFLNVAISHETGNLFVGGFYVERLLTISVVEIGPIETFHVYPQCYWKSSVEAIGSPE